MTDFFEIEVISIDGRKHTMAAYRGKYLLIVNLASKCGFTPQYKGLEGIHRKYGGKDFTVLGFPCNQFGGQEPGTSTEIKDFCSLNYGVTFPLFEKTDVNGSEAHPLYVYLKKKQAGLLGTGAIKWNFTKFLVGPEGEVLKRFAPATSPEVIEGVIREKVL